MESEQRTRLAARRAPSQRPRRRSSPARLIVCERTGRWAVALRRELADAGVRVWETRTLADCWNELAESPASFVVLELGGDVAGLLRPHGAPAARVPRGPAGRGGRPLAGRLRVADARGGGGPFPLFAAAGRAAGPTGLPPSGPSAAAPAEPHRADLGESAVGERGTRG